MQERLARVAIDSRLYVPGWCLLPWLRTIVEDGPDEQEQIAIAYNHETPIGVVYKFMPTRTGFTGCSTNDKYAVAVFVNEAYRGKGIGAKLIASVMKGESFGFGLGIDGSFAFFTKVHDRQTKV